MRRQLSRHVFTHPSFGENVVEIYAQAEMGMEYRHSAQGGGYQRIRLVRKAHVAQLQPLSQLAARFDRLWSGGPW